MSAFILGAGSDAVPDASELHLMPFSLTPTPSSAPVSAYFRPRVAPDGHAFAGSRVAAFRGRQVVAQTIDVPRGYRGVVLRTDAVPGKNVAPLTPATSIATSVGATSSSASIASEPDTASSTTRTTRAAARAKGSGQVALSRPRATRRAAAPSKRFQLDDDDDGDEEEPAPKRARRAKSPENAAPECPKTPESTAIPEINVVTATPGCDDLAREVDFSEAAGEDAPTPTETPSAPLSTAPPPDQSDDVPAQQEYEGSDGRPARVLVPTAAFERITLWTPDAPLAGFREDELAENTVSGTASEDKVGTGDEVKADEDAGDAPAPALVPTTTQLERSWWRQGGAGEGGDEFVRALGEWLGLAQIIHEPLYLDGMEDE